MQPQDSHNSPDSWSCDFEECSNYGERASRPPLWTAHLDTCETPRNQRSTTRDFDTQQAIYLEGSLYSGPSFQDYTYRELGQESREKSATYTCPFNMDYHDQDSQIDHKIPVDLTQDNGEEEEEEEGETAEETENYEIESREQIWADINSGANLFFKKRRKQDLYTPHQSLLARTLKNEHNMSWTEIGDILNVGHGAIQIHNENTMKHRRYPDPNKLSFKEESIIKKHLVDSIIESHLLLTDLPDNKWIPALLSDIKKVIDGITKKNQLEKDSKSKRKTKRNQTLA